MQLVSRDKYIWPHLRNTAWADNRGEGFVGLQSLPHAACRVDWSDKKYWSLLLRNTVNLSGQIQLTIFEKYCMVGWKIGFVGLQSLPRAACRVDWSDKKYWSLLLRNTVNLSGQIQLTIFEKYCMVGWKIGFVGLQSLPRAACRVDWSDKKAWQPAPILERATSLIKLQRNEIYQLLHCLHKSTVIHINYYNLYKLKSISTISTSVDTGATQSR